MQRRLLAVLTVSGDFVWGTCDHPRVEFVLSVRTELALLDCQHGFLCRSVGRFCTYQQQSIEPFAHLSVYAPINHGGSEAKD